MKKLTLLLFLSLPAILAAQEIYPIDFLNQGTKLKKTYTTGKEAKVKISNINRFLYKVTAEHTDTDFNVTVPAILSGIKLPAFLNGRVPDKSTVLEPAPSPYDGSQSTAQLAENIEKDIAQIINIRTKINNAIDVHNLIVHISKDCDKSYDSIKANVIRELNKVLDSTYSDVNSGANQLEKNITSGISKSNLFYADIEKLLDTWESKSLDEFREALRGKTTTLLKETQKLNELKEKLKATKDPKLIKSLADLINEKEISNARFETEISDYKEDYATTKKDMEDKVTNVKTLLADINKFNEDGKVFIVIDDIKKVNESNYSYYSEKVTMKKDEVKFNFAINAEGQLTCDKPNEQKFEVIFRSKGGIKLDFSTGVFVNFGNKEFMGGDYFAKPTSDTTTMINQLNDNRKVLLSIGALMHIYQRSPAKVKVGGVVGASSTTGFDALNFHIGGCLILGDKDRFCLSAGATFREVKVLSDDYVTGVNYKTGLVPETLPTIKKFPATGFFIGLTYNISKFNK